MRWPSLLILALVAGCLDSATTSHSPAGDPAMAPPAAEPIPDDGGSMAPKPDPQSGRTTAASAEPTNRTAALVAQPENFRYTGSVDLLEQGRVVDFLFGTPVPVKSAYMHAWLEGTHGSPVSTHGRACYVLEARRYYEPEFKQRGSGGLCDTGTFLTSPEGGARLGARDVMSLDEDAFCICVYRLTLEAQEQGNELFWDISVEYGTSATAPGPPAPIHWEGSMGPVAVPAAGPWSECEAPLTGCDGPSFILNGTFDLEATLSWDLPTTDLDLFLTRQVDGVNTEISRDGDNNSTEPTTHQVLRYADLPPGFYRLWISPQHGVKTEYKLDVGFI